MIFEESWTKGDTRKTWQCLYQAACKARAGADLLTAKEAAMRELSDMRRTPKQREEKAMERVIEAVRDRPPVPPTWREVAILRESAILAYAVAEALDAHHAAHPEDGCGP